MIRHANSSDAYLILKLLNTYSNNTHINEEYIKNDMKELYSNYVVYEDDNTIIGMINYNKFGDYGEIIDIVVDDKHRRKHIGSSLLEYCLKDLENSNVTLEVRTSNISAIKLYEKYGFKIVGIRKKYYKESDAYMMQKESK